MKRKFDLPLTSTLSALALFVFIPMLSAFEFSIRTPAKGGYGWDQYLWAIREEEFFYYIIRSGWLAALTVLITLLVLVPTMTWLHLSKSKIRTFVASSCCKMDNPQNNYCIWSWREFE